MSDNLQDQSSLAEKLKRAREAMEDPARKEVRQKQEEDMAVRRQRAREAMEGYERRSKRETKEKLARQREQTAQEKIESERRRAADLAEARQKAEANAQAIKAAEEKAYTDRIQHIEESESIIESLKKDKGASLSPLRTLKSDLARAVQEEHMSLAQISLKQQEKQRLMRTQANTSSNRTSTIVLLLMIFALIAGGVAIFLFYPEVLPKRIKQTVIEPRVPSIIMAEKQAKLTLATSPSALRNQILAARNQALPTGTVINIYFVKSGPAGELRVGLRDMLPAIELALPETVLPSLTEDFMLGSYHGETNGNFLILKTRSFESTAYAMNREETSLAAALYQLFSGSVLPSDLLTKPFQDVVIRNHDTRVLRNNNGDTILMYAFLDRETLVIAENVETFTKVLGSWETPPPTP